MTEPKVKVTVEWESMGPSGNSFFLVAKVGAYIKQVDPALHKQFRNEFKLYECKSYEEVLYRLMEWVYLDDRDGKYTDLRL